VTAPSALYNVRIDRVTPKTQASSLGTNSTYQTAALETLLDKITYIMQEINEDAVTLDTRADANDVLWADFAADVAATAAALAAALVAQTAAELAETHAETAETNAEAAEVAAAASAAAAAASEVVAAGLLSMNIIGGSTVAVPESTDGSAAIPFTGGTPDPRNCIFIKGANLGANTMIDDPPIEDGYGVGQELWVIGTNSSNYVVIPDTLTIVLNGPISIVNNTVLKLFWNGTVWVEEYRNGI
jgi:hypothetical protein